jgi:hypothetical protein
VLAFQVVSIHRFEEPDVPRCNEVLQAFRIPRAFSCHRDDETKVAVDQFVTCFFVTVFLPSEDELPFLFWIAYGRYLGDGLEIGLSAPAKSLCHTVTPR